MKRLLITVICFFAVSSIFACHIAGGQLTYQHISGNSYLLTLTMFEECDCSESVGAVSINVSSSCYASQTVPLTFVEGGTVAMSCVSNPTVCDGSTYDGFHANERRIFQGTVTLPGDCSDYLFSFTQSARSQTDFTDETSFYVDAFLNSTLGPNSSPSFSSDPFLYACDNELFTYDNVVIDSDGDQLEYEIVCPKESEFVTLSYSGGQNCSEPLPMSGGISISSQGLISFTSNPLTAPKTSVIAMQVSEYRSGQLIGRVVRDMTIQVYSCNNELPSASGITGNNGSVNIFGEIVSYLPGTESCFTISSTDPDFETGDVMQIQVLEAPDFATYTYSNTGGIASVTVCMETPLSCDPSAYNLKLKVTDGHCDIPGTSFENYQIIVEEAPFCNDFLYLTNRNLGSTIPMPVEAHASNTIYIGDDMPPAYTGIEGPVELYNDLFYVAGVEIVFPACLSGTGDCITVDAGTNKTFVIQPNNCSTECPYEPLQVEFLEQFACGAESLIANVTGGQPPYTFFCVETGTTNILGTSSPIDVHDFVAYGTDPEKNYTFSVTDVVGSTVSTSGYLRNTSRFYEPLTNNMTYIDYPGIGADGYYYDAQLVITDEVPFVIKDGVNTTAPWYGATRMELFVTEWNEPGNEEYHHVWDITQFTNDWSIDNAEVFWNGTVGNLGVDCSALYEQTPFSYSLISENCYGTYQEEDQIILDQCYWGDWYVSGNVIQSKSPTSVSDAGRNENNFSPQINVTPVVENGISFYPNPTNGVINIEFGSSQMSEIRVYDVVGNLVYATNYNLNQIDLSYLSRATYIIEFVCSDNIQRSILVLE